VLGLVQRQAQSGETREELGVVRARGVRGAVPVEEALVGVPRRLGADLQRHPGADLGRQVEHLVLLAPQYWRAKERKLRAAG
jgi:hypothetical protein